MGRDLVNAGVNQDVHGMRKEGPFLNMVVGNEVEGAALRENGGFIVGGTVFESEECVRSDLAGAEDLNGVSCGKQLAICRAHFQKAVNGSLQMAGRYRLCHRGGR